LVDRNRPLKPDGTSAEYRDAPMSVRTWHANCMLIAKELRDDGWVDVESDVVSRAGIRLLQKSSPTKA
jgi:hypothetical protein